MKSIDRMDVLFGSSFAKLEDVGKPFTRCGKTRCASRILEALVSLSKADVSHFSHADDTFNSYQVLPLGFTTNSRKQCILFLLEGVSSNGLVESALFQAATLSCVCTQ